MDVPPDTLNSRRGNRLELSAGPGKGAAKELGVGRTPEQLMTPPDTQDEPEPVTWIGRERLPFERVAPGESPPAEVAAPTAQPSRPRRNWVLPGAVALADQQNVPLISVVTPGLKPVTSSVTFTGAIAARYDMPIGNDGDTGRIIGVYVQ